MVPAQFSHYITHDHINPIRIMPVGLDQDLTTQQRRERFG